MNNIPSSKECIDLLNKSGCSHSVIRHCRAVRNLAVKIAKRTNANVELVEAGALLHDIGRSKTHGILHGFEGAKIARDLKLPNSIIRIIERHVGAGIPIEDAKKLGLPVKDYMPKSIEEKIVCHSDNLIDNSRRHMIENEIEKANKQGYKKYAKRLRKLHDELSDLCGLDLNNI